MKFIEQTQFDYYEKNQPLLGLVADHVDLPALAQKRSNTKSSI